jgi:hypothetical protein
LRRCDLDSHHFRLENFFARSRMRRESFGHGLDSVLGLRWGRCSTFITRKWNGIPLRVLFVYSWKVLSWLHMFSFYKNSDFSVSSCSFDSSSHDREYRDEYRFHMHRGYSSTLGLKRRCDLTPQFVCSVWIYPIFHSKSVCWRRRLFLFQSEALHHDPCYTMA